MREGGEFVDVTLVDHHEGLQEEGSCTFWASSAGSRAKTTGGVRLMSRRGAG